MCSKKYEFNSVYTGHLLRSWVESTGELSEGHQKLVKEWKSVGVYRSEWNMEETGSGF